eukprot:TRINITY_DN2091_c0_g1_i4.p1 TRINITY_DN2091_c0_g1~~TRINITY_DN2091_c0_g1_i4.p1  ORF type:complete len:161 (+),score=18.33 TRINITY_DN2091_c0_g1_i4:199-681(+)
MESAKGTPLVVYGHWVSQPARAVMWALKIKGVDWRYVEVDPSRGDTRRPDFANKFLGRTIPAIEDEDVYLFESNAVLPYLADKYNWEDWYPKDIRSRALINQYLCYHISGTRQCSTTLFRPILFAALKRKPRPTIPEASMKALNQVFNVIEVCCSSCSRR